MDELVGVIFKRVDKAQSITTNENRSRKVVPLKYCEEGNIILKIIFVGDSYSSAKTSFIHRYVSGVYSEITHTGNDFRSKHIVSRGTNVKLQLLSFPGVENYLSITSIHLRGADGIVVGYGIIDRESFERARRRYMKLKTEYPDAVIMVVGNKVDLEKYREVSREEGEILTRELGAELFFEVSAKAGMNINESMEAFVDKILENKGY